MYAFGTVINLSWRVILGQRSMALDRLKCFSAISNSTYGLGFTMKDALVFLLILLTWIPSTIWAGAIIPVTSPSLRYQQG